MWTGNENKIKVNIIRHGKTEYNERHCYIGITDGDLSCNGRNELMEKKGKDIYPSCQKLFTSPMKRAIQSVEIMYPDMDSIPVNQLKEMDFGSFEGKNYENLKDNIFYRKWIDESRGASKEELKETYGELENPDMHGIVLPEAMTSYYDRVLSGFKEILLMAKDCEEISIVAHGGTIMAIASALSGDDYYSFMFGCGEGIKAEVEYRINDGIVEISCFSITGRIHT